MTEQGPVGVAIVGCGGISGGYARTMSNYPDRLTLVGAYDLNPNATRAFAEAQHCKGYESLEELLRDDSVELAVNLTSHLAHGQVTRKLLEGGMHVHTEKPLAPTRTEGRTCVEVAQKNGLLLSCSPIVILGEAQQTLKKLVAERAVGDVLEAFGDMTAGRLETWHDSPAGFYGPGAGPLLDIGCYPLSVLVYLFGSVVSVRAMGGIRHANRKTKTGVPFIVTSHDHIVALLEFACGLHARLTSSFLAVRSHQSGLELHGTNGSIWMETSHDFNAKVHLCLEGEDGWRDVPFVAEPYRGVEWSRGLLDMASALREGTDLTCPGTAGYHMLDVSLSALAAAQSGQTVPVRSTMKSLGD